MDGLKGYVNDGRFRVDGDKNMGLLTFAFTIVFMWTGPLPESRQSFEVTAARISGLVNLGCLLFDRKIRLGCRKHNDKRFTSLPQNCHIRYGLNLKKGRICVA